MSIQWDFPELNYTKCAGGQGSVGERKVARGERKGRKEKKQKGKGGREARKGKGAQQIWKEIDAHAPVQSNLTKSVYRLATRKRESHEQ